MSPPRTTPLPEIICAPQQILRPMFEMGQKPALPRRSIAVCFRPNKQTPTARAQCDAMCQERSSLDQLDSIISSARSGSAEGVGRPIASRPSVTDELEMGCSNRQVGWLGPPRNSVHIFGNIRIRMIRSVRWVQITPEYQIHSCGRIAWYAHCAHRGSSPFCHLCYELSAIQIPGFPNVIGPSNIHPRCCSR